MDESSSQHESRPEAHPCVVPSTTRCRRRGGGAPADLPRRRRTRRPQHVGSYAEALAALYPAAYTLRFDGTARGHDETSCRWRRCGGPDDLAAFTSARDTSRWSWIALLLAPTWVDDDAVGAVARTKRRISGLERVGLRQIDGGVQALHIGPYDDQVPVMHDVEIPGHGCA